MKGSEPEYDIVSPSAWDHIHADDVALRAAAAASSALVYGSLAQRGARSRESIQVNHETRFLQETHIFPAQRCSYTC